jgi:peptidoglycan/LPS O-acetylase OafA/YrhL
MPPSGIIAKPEGQLFFSARFSVDTFFFLSGFLVGKCLLLSLSALVVLLCCDTNHYCYY